MSQQRHVSWTLSPTLARSFTTSTVSAPISEQLLISKRDDMPTLDTSSTSSPSESITTPSVTVPPMNDNPFIMNPKSRQGTVFIIAGIVIVAILLLFIAYWIIVSIMASQLAKRAVRKEKQTFDKQKSNNNAAFGNNIFSSPSLNSSEKQLVSKLPLLSHHRGHSGAWGLDSLTNEASILNLPDLAAPTTKEDTTKLFVSPTRDAMFQKKQAIDPSGASHLPFFHNSSSSSNINNQRQSQMVSGIYADNAINNSDYGISKYLDDPNKDSQIPQNSSRQDRRATPSMYLDDLLG